MPPTTPQEPTALTYLTTTLSTVLTTATNTYTAYILPLLPPPLQSVSLTVSSTLSPLITRISSDGTSTIDVVSLASLLLIFYLSLRILDFMRKSVFAWLRFLVKIGLVLLVVQMGLYVQAYGWEKAARDAGWVGGIVWGWLEAVVDGTGTNQGQGTVGGKGYGKEWNTSGDRLDTGGGGTKRRGAGAWS